MKSIALLVLLALQTTGLWDHTPSGARQSIINHATGVPVVAQTPPTPDTALISTALPILANTTPLSLGATSAVAIDRDTATVLYSKDADAQRPIASVTKMVTALVILQTHKADEIITIPKLPDYPVEAETLGLVTGDTFRLDSLLEALLVPSANDAADSLAIADSESIGAFTNKMNAYMHKWGIEGTHFASASGLQDTGNSASATALAKIGGLLLHNPTLTGIVAHTSAKIISGQNRVYSFTSTNELLASGNFYGIKTGYTAAAGECFVGLTRINGHEVITVVLDADSRFGATTTLVNWIRNSWTWI